MSKKLVINGHGLPIGGGRSVFLFLEKDGGGMLECRTPIQREDFRGGKPVPRVQVSRHNNKLVHQVFLSPEALRGLQRLLNELLD